MARAIWNNQVIAESERFEMVEGNVYFPAETVAKQYLQPSETTTVCSWKGIASYYSLKVDGAENKDAAWYYREPKPAAKQIKDHIAFWRGVKVEK